MAWAPAHQVGDVDPLISDAKNQARKFSYGRAEGLGTADTSDVYTEGFGRFLATYKGAVRQLVQKGLRPGPVTDTDPEFDWATKVQLNLIPRSNVPPAGIPDRSHLPLYISVEGHMSDMFIGPAVGVGQQLEREGLVQLQPTGYNNTVIPFDNESGIREVVRFFNDPRLMPPGRKWCLAGFSQGEIVTGEFLLRHVLPESGMFHHKMADWVCSLEMGAPYREKDQCAPWIPDPPRPGTQGISGRRLYGGTWGDRLQYVVRHGDLYTENPDSGVGLKQTSIYNAVQGDPSAFLFELLRFGIDPTTQVIETAQALLNGGMFLLNMGPHGMYDLDPAIDWARGKVKAALAA